MPLFQFSALRAIAPPANHEKWLAVDHGARCAPYINLELLTLNLELFKAGLQTSAANP
jgi:hypothetical protein